LALTKVTSGVRTLGTGEVATANMAVDPTNASNLSSGSVPLAQLGNAPSTDTTTIEDDIALLGFKVAVAGTMAKYNLVDQTEDAFVDATGIDASGSTNERHIAAGYYVGGTALTPTASGGTITTVGDYTFHNFTSSGDFITDMTQNMEVLLVAGGGGGGKHSGGGAGAGGLVYQAVRSVASGTHAFVRGSGGAGRDTGSYPSDGGGAGANGQDSTFNTLTAKGGGGGSGSGGGVGAGDGGSGGGAGRGTVAYVGTSNQSSQAGDSGTYGFGFDGGAGTHTGAPYPADGGGGAGAIGGAITSTAAGAGGIGKYLASFAAFGESGYFAGGGGGNCQDNSNYGAGGTGGGARGGNPTSGSDGMGRNGTDNTGGGGGGSMYTATGGANTATGGSGVLLIKRATDIVTVLDLTLKSNATTAETAPTKGDIVMTYTNGAGTASLNTDLTAEFSANDGGAWTSMTLVAQGTTGSASPHFIVSAHNVTLATASGTAMRYRIKTLNQSAAKETRIQAVSLGWS